MKTRMRVRSPVNRCGMEPPSKQFLRGRQPRHRGHQASEHRPSRVQPRAPVLAVREQRYGLVAERAHRRERAAEADREPAAQLRRDDRRAGGEPHDEAEQERARDVDRERAERERGRARLNDALQDIPRQRADDSPEGDVGGHRHKKTPPAVVRVGVRRMVSEWLVIGGAAFVASTLAAVAGFGGAAVLLPALVAAFGVRDAIPILTVAQLAGNGSRVWFNRREVHVPVVGWFALGAVPLALLGGVLFATAPLGALKRLVGAFLLLMVLWRHVPRARAWRPGLVAFAGIGAAFSFLSALVGSVGPLMAPFFLAYGLVKGAYIGTEALATVVMHVTKLAAYQGAAVLTLPAVGVGLALGPIMIFGSYVGKRILDRLPERVFVVVIELVLVGAGLWFLIGR